MINSTGCASFAVDCHSEASENGNLLEGSSIGKLDLSSFSFFFSPPLFCSLVRHELEAVIAKLQAKVFSCFS